MPTTVKTSTPYATLGDLSTYNVSTSATPIDTGDTSGSIPTVSATFVDGTDVDNLIAESFTISSPTVGTYDGEVVNVSRSANTNKYNLDVHNIMNRLNTELRVYPLSDYSFFPSVYVPVAALEYYTQQCGIFMTKVPGDVLFFQSQHMHFGAYGKGIKRMLKSGIFLYSGSEGFGGSINLGRMYHILPRDSESIMTFPNKTYLTDLGGLLPVPIPKSTSGKSLVIGNTVKIDGTSRQGIFTYRFIDAQNRKRHIRLTMNASTGFTLATSEDGVTFTSRGVIAAAAGDYTVYVGLNTTSTATSYRMVVVKPDNTVQGNITATATGSGIKGSLRLTQISYLGSNQGSGNPFLYCDNFIATMSAVPTTWPVLQKSITPGTKDNAFSIGFSGNVWEHCKQLCSVYNLDMNYRNGLLTIEPRQTNVKVGTALSELSTTVSDRDKARSVEIVNQQHTPTTNNPQTLWAADQVYQVAVGEVQEFTVQTKHSIAEVSQPICVSGISPLPYTAGTGQYVVTGSDGYIVSPQFWKDQGGSITCDITENEGEIKVKIKGPDYDSSRAPYRISEGDAGRPALYITGQGVKADPKTLKIPTGNSSASKDVGATIDSPFVGNAKQAYDAGFRAAKQFALPSVSVSFAEPIAFDEVSALGTIPTGSLVRRGGRVFRVNDANQTPSMISGSAEMHNTLYQINRSFAGATLAQKNAYYAGKPIGKINLNPVKDTSSVK